MAEKKKPSDVARKRGNLPQSVSAFDNEERKTSHHSVPKFGI